MQRQPNHGRTYYRCRFPSEYAMTAEIDHPATIYVREAPIVTALDQWLAALEAGADPATVAAWTREVQGQRLAAERALAPAAPGSAITPTGLGEAVGDVQRLVRKLAKANPTLRAELYQGLGVRATYLPESNEVELIAQPIACATVRVEGPTSTPSTRAPWRATYLAA